MGRHRFLSRTAPSRISPHRNPSGHPNPRQLVDIMMQAGRLAAEYLVSRGEIPASALPPPPSHPRSRESSPQPAERPERRPPPPARGRRGFTDYERSGWRERSSERSRLRGSGRDRDSPLGKRSGRRFDNADSEDEFRGRRGRHDRFRDEMRPRSEAMRRRRWRDDEMPSDSGREYEFDDEVRSRGNWGMRHGGDRDRDGDGDGRVRERERYHPVEADRWRKGDRRIGREANTRDSHAKREYGTSEYMNMHDESTRSSCGSKQNVTEAAREEGSSEHSGRERSSGRRHEHSTTNSPDGSSRTSLSFGSKATAVMETVREEDTSMDSGSREETLREVTSSPLKLLQENGQSSLDKLKEPHSDDKEPESDDQETVGEVTEEKDLEPVAYKTCDLNLMESSDTNGTPLEPDSKKSSGFDLCVDSNVGVGDDDKVASVAGFDLCVDSNVGVGDDNKVASVAGFDLCVDSNVGVGDDDKVALVAGFDLCVDSNVGVGDDDKVASVVDLENGSRMEDYVYDSSKTKSDGIYSSLGSEWSKMVARDGTPGVRDGLNLEIS